MARGGRDTSSFRWKSNNQRIASSSSHETGKKTGLTDKQTGLTGTE